MTLTSGNPSASTAPSARDLALEAETHARAARKLHSHAGVASILNTKPGKMTLLQMQRAVQRKQKDEQQREEQVAIMAKRAVMGSSKGNEEEKAATTASSAADNEATATAPTTQQHHPRNASHPLDYSVNPDTDALFGGEGLQMQELVFSRALALYAAHERSLEINPTKHRIGAALMTEAQRDQIEEEREAAKAAAAAASRAKQREQSQNLLSSARVISMVGERSLRAPTFIVDESEPWASRARLLSKLKGAINKFVVRRRVDERLANVAAHAAHRAKNKLERLNAEDGEEVDQKRTHPLLPSETERDEDWVLRDFPLCTTNVQSVGHQRGHDAVTRAPVALEAISKPNQLVTFDEVIPFDAALMGYPVVSAPVVPTFVGSDWLAGQRTGAWEESLLRAPRGESEVEEATAAAAASKLATPASGVAMPAPLMIHAQLPSSVPAAAPLLTSPVHTSVSLLDVDSQNSRPIKPVPPAVSAATAGTNAVPAAAATASAPAAAAGSRSAHTKTSDLRLPSHFLSSHPIAQQHAVASSPSLSVPLDVPANTELSPNYSFRAANMRESADTGFFYKKEGAGCSSLRTLQGMTTLSDLWRPKREPALAGVAALVDSFSLPLGFSSSASAAAGGDALRHLRRQPREDRIDPRDREVAGDETSAKLRYKPVKPSMALASTMYDQAAASVAAAAEKAAQASAAPAASHAASAAAPATATAHLDIGLGLSLLSTAIQFPPALAAAAARAQAQSASSATAAAATVAGSSAAVAASPRSSRGRRDDSAASEDTARSRRDGASSPSERSRSKKSAASASVAAPIAQPPPRLRGTHGSALPPAGSGVAPGEAGFDLLLPASSVVALQLQPASAVIAHASSGPGAPAAAASLLPVARAPAQALALSAFQSSSTAAPAASSSSSAAATAGMNPSSLSWGSGAQAASAALQQRLSWAQVQPTNALALAAQAMQPLTQHPQQHLTLLTQK